MNTNELIEELARGVEPVRPLKRPGARALAWLVGAAAWAAFRRPRDGATLPRATAWAAGLAVVAIVVHSCFYNAFFEDPMVWGSLGLVALAAAARTRGEAA